MTGMGRGVPSRLLAIVKIVVADFKEKSGIDIKEVVRFQSKSSGK